ncbi:MFS transporter [Streptomyces sp. NPDC056373]|uniref:MFS transporter n=1 Tax=Streptomyces sp. NPDC056373 TaxID=3345798 RepID=UPI0035E2A614
MSPLLPDTRPRRVLALATLVGTIGKGIFLTAGVLYFTRSAHLPVRQVGIGLSVAGFISVAVGVLAGYLADRRGARGIYVASLVLGGLATAGFCLVSSFWPFLVVASLAAAAQGAGLIARGPLIRRYGGRRPQEFRAYIQSVTNVGISVGAAVAGWAAQADTRSAYLLIVIGNAVMLLASAAIMLYLPPVAPEAPAEGPRWLALRDRPYIALSLLDGILSIQYRVLTVAIPLWLVSQTAAPRWLISAIVIANTAIVVLFQVRASKGIDSPRAAGFALRRSGVAFLISCVAIAWSAGVPTWVAVTMLVIATVVHSVGELWQAAGGFEISFELAPSHSQGQYLGVFGIGLGLAESFGPALLTSLCIGLGKPGWYIVGLLFLVAGLVQPAAVRWAERTRNVPGEQAVSKAPGVPVENSSGVA